MIAEASLKLKHCMVLCNGVRKRKSFGESISTLVKKVSLYRLIQNVSMKSLLMRQLFQHNYDSHTDLEVHAELCYAEVLLLRAILTFMEDEELLSFVKGSLKIKQCYSSYKLVLLLLFSD